ncbi:MAG: hypothetical protein K0R58_3159 [Ramlibacter sp.]|jgi:hypothetical protein|nr:hypothetical protein [Ramlibacter sp.]
MSAHPAKAFDAVAAQLVAALERYAADTAGMVTGWPDMERYRSVSEQIEQIRIYAAALPEARVQWVELLIAHSELVHILWQAQFGHGGLAVDDALGVRLHHTGAVAALRHRCLRIGLRRPRAGAH